MTTNESILEYAAQQNHELYLEQRNRADLLELENEGLRAEIKRLAAGLGADCGETGKGIEGLPWNTRNSLRAIEVHASKLIGADVPVREVKRDGEDDDQYTV